MCSHHLLLLALLAVTILSYTLSFIAVVLFFVFYTKPDGCLINKFFISFNMLFCFVASVVSVLNKVQVQQREIREKAVRQPQRGKDRIKQSCQSENVQVCNGLVFGCSL